MKAVILAAGKGTRMRELTNALPKPMLQVWGKPILEHILLGLISAGIREVFIVTGYRADTIESHFGDGRRWGVSIDYGRQMVQDGTGKAPEVAREFVKRDDFLLTYGDILVKPETYRQMVERFATADFSGLLTVTRGMDVAKGAIVLFDSEFCFDLLIEKPSAPQIEQLRTDGRLKPGDPAWYNAGIYIFRPALYDFTRCLEKSPRGEYELTDAITAMRAAGHRLAGLEIAGRWVDVRDPEVLAALEKETPA
jgi:dTDP-glucose pyrophosphorylase